jgi:hypothetical protein
MATMDPRNTKPTLLQSMTARRRFLVMINSPFLPLGNGDEGSSTLVYKIPLVTLLN